jgi:hypothetical protein
MNKSRGLLDSARQILETAIKAGGDARREAERVVHYLGRRGHTGFGDLLSPGDAPNRL